jgi:hypothetical protein
VLKDFTNAAETLNIGTACSVKNENQVRDKASNYSQFGGASKKSFRVDPKLF